MIDYLKSNFQNEFPTFIKRPTVLNALWMRRQFDKRLCSVFWKIRWLNLEFKWIHSGCWNIRSNLSQFRSKHDGGKYHFRARSRVAICSKCSGTTIYSEILKQDVTFQKIKIKLNRRRSHYGSQSLFLLFIWY